MALLEKNLYIKKSTLIGAGTGLFTKKKILKGTRIVEYKGKTITWSEAKKLPDKHNGYLFFINNKKCIDAWGYKKALGRYANDAKGIIRVKGLKTNADYVVDGGRCYIEATKNILPYAEIFVEYGPDYWKVTRENNKIEEQEMRKKEKHTNIR